MGKSNEFSAEVRERAVRMGQEQRGEYPSLRAAIAPVAPKMGCAPQTLNEGASTPRSMPVRAKKHAVHRRNRDEHTS